MGKFVCELFLFIIVILHCHLGYNKSGSIFLIVQLSQSEQDRDRQMTFTLFQSTTGDISPSNHTFMTNLTTQSFADTFDNYFATNAAWFNGKCQPCLVMFFLGISLLPLPLKFPRNGAPCFASPRKWRKSSQHHCATREFSATSWLQLGIRWCVLPSVFSCPLFSKMDKQSMCFS